MKEKIFPALPPDGDKIKETKPVAIALSAVAIFSAVVLFLIGKAHPIWVAVWIIFFGAVLYYVVFVNPKKFAERKYIVGDDQIKFFPPGGNVYGPATLDINHIQEILVLDYKSKNVNMKFNLKTFNYLNQYNYTTVVIPEKAILLGTGDKTLGMKDAYILTPADAEGFVAELKKRLKKKVKVEEVEV